MTTTIVPLQRPIQAPRRRARRGLAGLAYYAVGGALALAFLFPLVYIGLRSLLPQNADAAGIGLGSLLELTLSNYQTVFNPSVGIYTYIGNSLVLAISTAVLTTVVATLAGYALSRISFRFSGIVFVVLLLPLLVPYQGLLTPLSLILSSLHLLNTLPGLILVLTTFQLPFSIFVMRNTFDSVPIELEEAAQVDGASLFTVLRSILVPLCWPGLVTVALFGFMTGWNDLLTSVVFLSSESNYTLPIVLTSLATSVEFGIPVVHTGLLTATACIATLPVVLLFLGLQRFYTKGLIGGALK